ncbi:hypothetical protein WICANDRAFT_81007 [Wickerhamomyces anomalus NRRL Y-366-8]|uniref:Protein CSF1 n=1 Tax=Wickerhamomyces anomalus (strain ATCC 58044 / CBS 1984 / NCYC 433 / NRRL Y-366-8) TaxID=683960 RepID=A0A1E3NWW6_WICAA|nr:uncharacterized protein WICANDRAFT_81007 [Wickerhamomyces anomalus NRRL Y-366-8]ODQ57679.1 hypothetical protein WICANDRAFT_81007 [Wickerhamomyces anomalus NRRL Y-366-8]
MDASSQFASVSITRTKDFSWVFFADWFLTYFLAIGIIFYFSRFIGVFVSYALRVLLWKTKKIKIDVQSIKLSFLGGRLFFRNFTMIDRDQTICALQGSITWRYWIPRVRKTELELQNGDPDGNIELNSKLPCRIIIEVDGLEVFVYNRTVSYENIMSQLSAQKNTRENKEDDKANYDVFSNSTSESTIRPDERETASPSSFLMKILPIKLKVNKGAIVAGNKTTQAILVVSYATGDGIIDLLKADNPLDEFRQSFQIDFERLQVALKPNISYQGEKSESSGLFFQKPSKKKYANRWMLYRSLINLWNIVIHKHKEKGQQAEWRGLAQYIDADTESINNVKEREHEYGKYTNILDSDFCSVEYYYDLPGPVPVDAPPTNPLDGLDIGNGGSSPKFGMNVKLSNSTIFYGPWAERQRHSLHQMLFPTLCRDGVPQGKLKPGKLRIYTQYQLFVEIMDEAIIRVPIREFSKNEEFAKIAKEAPDLKRPFGWIELKMDKGSIINVKTGLIASNSGYDNRMTMTLQNLEVRSSVNHDIMMRCKEHVITADIGYPLRWNGHTIWTFLNESKNVDTFFLREHITLLSDMFTDFASGPATPYELFRPFTYVLDWKVSKYAIYMNVNDANIINNPLDFNDNIYLSFQGDTLDINVHIPLEAVLRKVNTISYTLSTPQLSMMLDTPPWHTLNNFLEHKEVGRSKDFKIEGSYTYHSEVGLDLVDTIIIGCKGKYMVLKCYGFVVKYIISIKENYFGDFTTFKTLEEYTQLFNEGNENDNSQQESTIDQEAERKRAFKRIENEKDVHFSFDVEEGRLVLPSNIYDCSSNMSLFFSTLNMDLRFTNYYMDFEADITPAKGIYVDKCGPQSVLDFRGYESLERHDLFIDGLAIHGHRMFGLPPDELKYFCKWDLAPGEVDFTGRAEALEGLISSVIKLGFGYKNLENNLLIDEPEIHDVTSVSLVLPKVHIKLDDPQIDSTVVLELSKISFFFIDVSNPRYTERASAVVENILLNNDFAIERAKQDDHVLQHDGPFHRVPFFLREELRNAEYNGLYGAIVPSFSIPDGSPPITSDTIDMVFDDLGLDSDPITDDSSSEASSMKSQDTSMDFFQDFKSDFLKSPGGKPQKNNRKKNYFKTVAGSYINPTGNYRDQDFTPSYTADPNYEYDNFILNFGDIDVTAAPNSVSDLLKFADQYLTRSMIAVLDDLHIAVLKKLHLLRNMKPAVKNIRLVTPKVSLNFGDFAWDPKSEPSFNLDHLGVVLENPSLACSFTKTTENTEEAVIALHILNTVVGLYEAKDMSPFKLTMEDLEIWLNKTTKKTESASLRKFDVELQSDKVEWLKAFIENLINSGSSLLTEALRIKDNVKKSEIELLYQISLASTIFKVEHDPAVITRPAYIIRLSRQHIRANDSWKIITRLRHIYENLPEQWINEHQQIFLQKNFQAPDTAENDVVDVFSKWRSWEFDDMERTYIFRYVFSKILHEALMNSIFECSVEDAMVKLSAHDCDHDFIALDFLEVSGTKSFVEALNSSLSGYDNSNSTSVRVALIRGKLSPLTQVLKSFKDMKMNFTKPSDDSPASVSDSETKDNFGKKVAQYALIVDSYDFKIDLYTISAGISGSEVALTALHSLNDKKQDITTTFDSKRFTLEVRTDKAPSITYTISNFGFNVSSANDFKAGPKVLDVHAASASFVMQQGTDHYTTLLCNVNDDLHKLKLAFVYEGSSKREVLQSSSKSTLWQEINSATARLKVKKLSWNMSVVDPLSIVGSMENYEVMVSLANFKVVNALDLSSFTMSIKSKELEILKLSSKSLSLVSRAVFESKKVMEILVHSGSTVLLIPDILPLAKHVNQTISQAKSSVSRLKNVLQMLKDSNKSNDLNTSTVPTNVNIEPIDMLKKISFVSDTFLVAVKVANSTYGIDLKGISCSFQDFDSFDVGPMKVKPFGSFEVESTKLVIKDRQIASHISTIFDVNFGLKVFNSYQDDAVLQTLQIESAYCRLMLHPRTIVKMIEFGHDVSYLFGLVDLSPSKPKQPSTDKIKFISYFHSIHMLFYNFCVGFMFEEPSDDYAGIIAGCEKVFVISEESYGKLSLIHAYFSIANGQSSSDFYSSVNELESPNRAFLPNMQVMYAVKKANNKKDFMIRVTGEELDVKFVSSSIVLIEQTLKSVGTIESLKKKIRKYPKKPPSTVPQEGYKLPSDVTSITCFMNFAGGLVKLYRSDDFELLEDPYSPSFELRTPAVKIAAEYSKTSGLKDHHVNFEVFTSSSNNTLYSTCVPVLMDIWHSVKSLGGSSKSSSSVQVKKDEASSIPKDTEFLKVLTNFHVNLAIHIDKQELSLSCEPSAKVQAVVGIESIDIRLGTNDEDVTQPLSGILSIEKLGASLQHIYSREISGSVEVDQLIITFLLTGPEKLKVYAAGKIENVASYVNLKQLQDLDLFKDLWFPNENHPHSSSSSLRSVVSIANSAHDENLVLRFQNVSSSRAVPWNFDFMILNVNLEVDLGQSLGILTLELDRFWAASRKKTNWEQNMAIGFDTISLKSKGRLSGHLSVKNIRVHSVIQWSLVGDSFDIPLVLLSFGLQSIEAKASFDYNVFLIARILNSYITVYNQIDKEKVLQDKLVASTICQSIEIFTTALAASNILDIYNTISRIRQDNKRSYREDLKTSKADSGDHKKSLDILNVIATLRTELEVKVGKFLLQVYPGSLLDSQVLIIDVGGLTAHFEQKLVEDMIGTDLKLKLHNTSVALSSFRKQLPEELLTEMSVEKYIIHAATAKGGSIFIFPSLESAMQTWQAPKSNIIKYKFKSQFGGKVEVRWNLGSVNFIREMWATHARAFSSRLQKPVDVDNPNVPIYEDVNIEEKLKDVELEGKYVYIAIEAPIIDAPQLRDLGDATPPLEWFGLHRQRFPGITHQFVIVGLQKLVHEVEQQYGRVLGKA